MCGSTRSSVKWKHDWKNNKIPYYINEERWSCQEAWRCSVCRRRWGRDAERGRGRKKTSSYITGDFRSIEAPLSAQSWMNAGVSRGHQTGIKESPCVDDSHVKHFVYIEILSCYGALKILAARTKNPETKVWLVKHRIYELSGLTAVNDTDSNEPERCWTKPCDRVFGNVVECNNTNTTSRHPTERRKMSLSGERKEKDRRRKKFWCAVWLGICFSQPSFCVD